MRLFSGHVTWTCSKRHKMLKLTLSTWFKCRVIAMSLYPMINDGNRTPPFRFPFFESQYAYEASSGLREAVQLMPVASCP